MESLFHVVESTAMWGCLAVLACVVVVSRGEPEQAEVARRVARAVFGPVVVLLWLCVPIDVVQGENPALGVLAAAGWTWLWMRERDDDGKWKRRRRAAKAKIAELRGRLVVVPVPSPA